jgi:hypothetical protein
MPASTRRKATFAGLGLASAAGLLALGLAGPNIAFADPSPTPSGSASAPANTDREDRRAAQRDAYAEALAKELGIDKEKVSVALDKVDADRQAQFKAERLAALKTRLDAAVKDGKLTQAEADAILKAAENGALGEGPGGFGGGPGRHGRGPGG